MTTQTSLPPDLPNPPAEYDRDYLARLVDLIRQSLFLFSQRRALIGTTINLSRLPTSATGLRSGDVWVDVTVLKVVP